MGYGLIGKLTRDWNRKSKRRKVIDHYIMLILCNCDISVNAKISDGVVFMHSGNGTVIGAVADIKSGAYIMSNVTVGRANVDKILRKKNIVGNGQDSVIIGENAVISTGARVLCDGELTVGENTVIGANAVLLNSTGPNEIWAGVPAKKINTRI